MRSAKTNLILELRDRRKCRRSGSGDRNGGGCSCMARSGARDVRAGTLSTAHATWPHRVQPRFFACPRRAGSSAPTAGKLAKAHKPANVSKVAISFIRNPMALAATKSASAGAGLVKALSYRDRSYLCFPDLKSRFRCCAIHSPAYGSVSIRQDKSDKVVQGGNQ